MRLCYIDGRFVPPEEARLPLSDLIIQRGVGVFEVIGTHHKRPLMLTSHLKRLLNGAKRSRIRTVLSIEAMKDIVQEGLARLDDESQIKVYLSGGDVFDEIEGFTEPRFFVIFEKLRLPPPEVYENGVVLEPIFQGREDPLVKSVDYRATYALARSGAFEVLYCPGGEITEAGHSSFFLVVDGTLITAPSTRVLKGTTRGIVLELARREGLLVEERCPLLSELSRASEAFITGSIKKIVPVIGVGPETMIGNGHPGPITLRLAALYLQHIQSWPE